MENKDESPSRKKRKSSNKTVSKSLSSKPVDVEIFTSDQIRKLLKEVVLEGAYETRSRSRMEIDALVSTMEEFLRSFIVIGYNMKNEPLVVTNAKSQLDADALYTSLSRLFFSVNNNGGI